jgi:hypothetical protein
MTISMVTSERPMTTAAPITKSYAGWIAIDDRHQLVLAASAVAAATAAMRLPCIVVLRCRHSGVGVC